MAVGDSSRVAVDGVVDLELGYTILHRLSWQIDHPLIEVHIRLDPFEKCKINSQITTSFRFTFGFSILFSLNDVDIKFKNRY